MSMRKSYFARNAWTLPPLEPISFELRWRQLTKTPPIDVEIYGPLASRYYETKALSTLETMVIWLPEVFTPKHHSWPVAGLNVHIVECGVWDLTLSKLSLEYGAKSVSIHCHGLDKPIVHLPKPCSEVAA